MPLDPVHSDFSELCQCWPPSGPNRGARIGRAILTLRSPPPGRLGCSHVGEPNGLEPQEPPEEGPHHARRVETYSLADGHGSSLPHGLGTGVPDASKVGSHDPYQASPVPPVRWPSQPLEELRPWRHGACARALAPRCGDTRALSHVPHRARLETAPSHSLARSCTCMGPARPPPARCPALLGLGCACHRPSEIH